MTTFTTTAFKNAHGQHVVESVASVVCPDGITREIQIQTSRRSDMRVHSIAICGIRDRAQFSYSPMDDFRYPIGVFKYHRVSAATVRDQHIGAMLDQAIVLEAMAKHYPV